MSHKVWVYAIGVKIDCLTTAQLKKLWNTGSKITNYNQLDPSFPDVEVSLYGPGTDSGTFDFFTDEINGEEGVSRKEYQPSEDDNILVQGVSGDAGGLAYFGFSYYEQNQDKLNLVGVDAGDGCVKPSTRDLRSSSQTGFGVVALAVTIHSTSDDSPVRGLGVGG